MKIDSPAMTSVSLLPCNDYKSNDLRDAVRTSLEAFGLTGGLLKGKRVLIKPNLLRACPPEWAVVTHPEFFRAVVQTVKEEGGDPVMVESPALHPLARVMEETGYDRILREEHCGVGDTGDTAVLFYKGGHGYRRFDLPRALFEADIVLNLPKFKTHSLTYITGAVKNLFGLIHGLHKSRWHVKASSADAFSEFLLDLYEALTRGFDPPKKYFHLMDAVVGMEGEGPGRTGRPRKIGALIAGEDAVAVDAVAVNLVGLNPEKAPTILKGAARGLGEASPDRIRIRGRDPKEFGIRDFIPSMSTNRFDLGRWPTNTNFFKNLFVEKPVPVRGRCTLCYQCMTICSGKAIGKSKGDSGVPSYDYNKCIRCYCCREICPEAAIRLKRGALQWVLERF